MTGMKGRSYLVAVLLIVSVFPGRLQRQRLKRARG